MSVFIFIRRFHLISEELKNAQAYTKDFKQQILDLRGTLPSHRYVALLSFTRLTSCIHIIEVLSFIVLSLPFPSRHFVIVHFWSRSYCVLKTRYIYFRVEYGALSV